jgi:hypothetical protein
MENEIKKVKCYVCNKHIKLIDQIYCKCRCGKEFCQRHRYPESENSDHAHRCEYDYKTEGKKDLHIHTPRIISDKITNRV